ncbi:2-succinyl-5-enolpyruvyl-6-hydroxy-3-cyclohexene-1-carboxylic-acid synthase, partial [Chrysosporum ovalisporum ANA283AFssAo]|nr:2-succinyl-5-enolpyruvyl-6-hydroxy-3-cyclohexene-1-carboxylic-acid synthase [Umezakia ovalisporum ANA283AFssAo]
LNPYLISTYDIILRNQQLAQELMPEIVIQVGEMPTSKELRNWLSNTQPQRWIIDSSYQNLDPLHGRTTHLRISVEDIIYREIQNYERGIYLQKWCAVEEQVRKNIDQTWENIEELIESKAAWLISQNLPPRTPLFISNSMPVRDVEFFWKPNNLGIKPYVNRGANGIDGTLSTALGVAHHQQSTVMLTGDLALLHDTNGFLMKNKFVGHLTIILINNNGGGIFEMLPIAKFDPPFEEFFATSQDIDFALLCATYNVQHELISSWEHLKQNLKTLPNTGIRVLEVKTNRKLDAKWRKENLEKLALDITV